MSSKRKNVLGEPVATHAAKYPSRDVELVGRYATLVGLSPSHSKDLWSGIGGPDNAALWDYMFDGPFLDEPSFDSAIAAKAASKDPVFYAVLLNTRDGSAEPKAVGLCSLMRIDTANRTCEVGSIVFSPALQRTTPATEAMYLLARYAFEDLGFRRYEWKLNWLNEPSHRAAARLGFKYEGMFRQHLIVKGRNRDTAWYAMVDGDWPARKKAFEAWLDERNFDAEGKQRKKLEGL
ncbi:hypothetical protein MBLNU459_g1103t1 [Dothideomycetes sp. NU459]